MADSGTPIRMQTARLLGVKTSQGAGTLVLYPDKVVHVRSQAVLWASKIGLVVVAVPSLALPPHTGPGALGALIGGGGGALIGGVIARSRAAAKAAAAGDDVTVIPLDSITGIETRKSSGWLARQNLFVTTAGGADHGFSVKLERWSADLASALTARGCVVHATPQGMAVTPAPSVWGTPSAWGRGLRCGPAVDGASLLIAQRSRVQIIPACSQACKRCAGT
jgi:hypothetical protein